MSGMCLQVKKLLADGPIKQGSPPAFHSDYTFICHVQILYIEKFAYFARWRVCVRVWALLNLPLWLAPPPKHQLQPSSTPPPTPKSTQPA